MTQIDRNEGHHKEPVWTEIRDLKNNSRDVNIRFRVVKKGNLRQVTSKSFGRQYEVSDCIVADTTARINMTLWNEDVDSVEQDGWYCLLNGYINVYDECMILSKGRTGEIHRLIVGIGSTREDIDMSRPFMGKRRRRETHSKTGRTLDGTKGREVRRYASRKSF
jgi:hypothetical protein